MNVMNYLKTVAKSPVTILELVNNVLFFAIVFIPPLQPWFPILIMSSLLENVLKRQYKRIPIKLGVLLLFYLVSHYIGIVGVIILLLMVICVVMYKITKKKEQIVTDFTQNKDKMVLEVLQKLQPNETSYMKILKERVNDNEHKKNH